MKLQYGNTWWGSEWLKALEEADYENRLPRGRVYARGGAVISMHREGETLTAMVQGTRRTPYKVTLTLPPFPENKVQAFLDDVSRHPSIVTKLLHRELSPAVMKLAEKAGLSLFPSSMNDIEMHCSCPDWAHLCKHIAAVIYEVSRAIDNDPFQVFSLHGVSLVSELKKRHVTITNEMSAKIPRWDDLVKGELVKDMALPMAEETAEIPDFTKIKSLFSLWMRVLPASPAFYGRGSFGRVYEKTMTGVRKVAEKALFDSSAVYVVGGGKDSLELASVSSVHLVIEGLSEGKLYTDRGDWWPMSRFLAALLDMTEEEAQDSSYTVRAFREVVLLAIHLLRTGNAIPELVRVDENALSIRWMPTEQDAGTAEAMGILSKWVTPSMVEIARYREKRCFAREPAEAALSLFLTHLMQNMAKKNFADDPIYDLFFMGEPLMAREGRPHPEADGIASWLSYFHLSAARWQPVLLVSDDPKTKAFRLDLSVVDSEDSEGNALPLADVFTKKDYDACRYQILKDMDLLSSLVTGMEDYMDSEGRTPISFTAETFAPFLLEAIPAMRLLGARVILPKSLQHLIRPKKTLRLKKKEEGASHAPSLLSLEDMLDFDWQIALGDERISPEDFEKLSVKAGSLIAFKGQYLYVTEADLKKLEKMWQRPASLKGEELLRIALEGSYEGAEITMTSEVKRLLSSMKEGEPVALPKNVCATLRPYQKRGYAWLYNNSRLGFGSILADDMGLGKTLQIITFLEKLREEGRLAKKKALIVVPTSLLYNWQEEIARFAPLLTVFLYYGAKRDLADFHGDILLTTYGLLRSDQELFKKKKWEVFIIDEAQNIKNPDTAQSRAVRSMKAPIRIAISGTPVENSLKEFWSIMEFTNKGYLGSAKTFQMRYANPIQYEQDRKAAERFKSITAPMLLRRLKTDKTIISDLPDKLEQDEYTLLTPAQAALYHQTVEESLRVISEQKDGDKASLFKRQGLVLQMILALKEICNHPALFTKEDNWDPALSGKAERLLDLAESIQASREKALIFTQFKSMGDKLADLLESRLGERPMFLHGGCSLRERKEMVDRFQTDPKARFFILSLKAAGTGLNLTAASHVIHYDLWWNPAVESQATDRAYRIGQKNNVLVHRFITKNTFEEKINEIIQKKRSLADMTVSVGESWIGNMTDDELSKIFR